MKLSKLRVGSKMIHIQILPIKSLTFKPFCHRTPHISICFLELSYVLITVLCSASTHKTFKLSKFCQFRSPVCDLSSLRRRCPSSGIPECPLCPTSRSGKDHWRRAENGWDDTVIQQKQSKSSKLHWVESWSNKIT